MKIDNTELADCTDNQTLILKKAVRIPGTSKILCAGDKVIVVSKRK